MSDQNGVVTREDLERSAQGIVDTVTQTGESMTSPVFLKGLGAAAAMGVVYWIGRRRGRKRIRQAISELARMV
jgi:LPXTG-motif cell wall-anchored protein